MAKIKFIKCNSTEPPASYLAQIVCQKLAAGQRVLWLVPGGSAIQVATLVAELLVQSGQDLSVLSVTLSDERYGPPGHADSNWQQLTDAGFRLPGASLQPVLSGQDLVSTSVSYARLLADDFAHADYKIALLGIGPDGHIAGIKPGSPAVNDPRLAVGYSWTDFERLTITPAAIRHLDEVVCYATGEAKRTALDNLDKDLSLDVQPAQILKAVPQARVYNDIRGGTK